MTEAKASVRGHEVRFIEDQDESVTVIDSAAEIPQFPSEAEEQLWWRTHRFSEQFWETAPPVPDEELPPADLSRLAPEEREAWRMKHPLRRVQE